MVKLVALKSRRFGTQRVARGETFIASRQYARVWKALGLAADTMSTAEMLAEPPPPPPAEDADDLAGMTKAELVALAESHGLEVARSETKAALIERIVICRLSYDDEGE